MGKAGRQARSLAADFEASAPLGGNSGRNEHHAAGWRSAVHAGAGNRPRAFDAAGARRLSPRPQSFITPNLLSGCRDGCRGTCDRLVQAIRTLLAVARRASGWAWLDVLATTSGQ